MITCEQREGEGEEHTSISHPKSDKKEGIWHHPTLSPSPGVVTDEVTWNSGRGFGFGRY